MNIDLHTVFENLPDFQTHEEARSWFKEQFSDRFLLKNSDVFEETRVYYYHIVKNPQAYEEYMESLGNPEVHEISNSELFESYSTVEISEDGDISFSI